MFLVFNTHTRDNDVIEKAISNHLNVFGSSSVLLSASNEMQKFFTANPMATNIARLLSYDTLPGIYYGDNGVAYQHRRFSANNKEHKVIVAVYEDGARLVLVGTRYSERFSKYHYYVGFCGTPNRYVAVLNRLGLDMSIVDRFIIHQLEDLCNEDAS